MHRVRPATKLLSLTAPSNFVRYASFDRAIDKGRRQERYAEGRFDRTRDSARPRESGQDYNSSYSESRPPRRDNYSFRDSSDRSSRIYGDRPPGRGSYGDRPPPSRNFGDRPPRFDSRSGDSRPRIYGDRGGYDGGAERQPRRYGSGDESGGFERRPRSYGGRDGGESRPYERRSPRTDGSEAQGISPATRSIYDAGDRRYEAPREYVRQPKRNIFKSDDNAEFVYGRSAVTAALKAAKRKFFCLYIYTGEGRSESSQNRDRQLEKLAEKQGVQVKETKDEGLLHSMSNSQPHNGYVLEALPITKIPVLGLGAPNFDHTEFNLQLAQHDITGTGIIINELPPVLPNRTPDGRYPFVLMMDEVVDPHNLGAAMRSAYFLGVSALVVSERNCAPITGAALKVSSGAAEYLPILTQNSPMDFLEKCKEAGWAVFAGVPPPKDMENAPRAYKYFPLNTEEVKESLTTAPTILILGGEGEGLRENMKRLSDKFVTIPAALDVDKIVDSLNLSVASALLCNAFLRK